MNTEATISVIEKASREGITLQDYAGVVRNNKRKQKKVKPESALINTIIRYVYNCYPDIFIWRANAGAFKLESGQWFKSNIKGTPDLIGFRSPSGTFIGIEAKIHPNKLNPAQEEFKDRLQRFGGIHITAYSIDDVIEGLK